MTRTQIDAPASPASMKRDFEIWRAAQLLVGAIGPSSWVPRDATLARVVAAVHNDVVARGGLPDVTRVLDALHAHDPETDWAGLLHFLLRRFDEVTSRVTALRPAIEAARAVRETSARLDRAVSDLLSARERAESALDDLRRACDAAEAAAARLAGRAA